MTGLRRCKAVQIVLRVPAMVLVALARAYQWLISPLLGRHCRFEPSCSQYFIESVRKYGAIRGAWRGLLRVLRCHPWHPGGHDSP